MDKAKQVKPKLSSCRYLLLLQRHPKPVKPKPSCCQFLLLLQTYPKPIFLDHRDSYMPCMKIYRFLGCVNINHSIGITLELVENHNRQFCRVFHGLHTSHVRLNGAYQGIHNNLSTKPQRSIDNCIQWYLYKEACLMIIRHNQGQDYSYQSWRKPSTKSWEPKRMILSFHIILIISITIQTNVEGFLYAT